MTRATWVFAATSLVGAVIAIYLYLDNRDLQDKLAEVRAAHETHAQPAEKVAAAPPADPWTDPQRGTGSSRGVGTGPAPALPEEKKESRLDRRQRRQQEFAAMFGRLEGETEEEYKNRIVPLIKAGLLIPRQRVDEMRKQAEEKAGVTAEQSKKLDQAFEKVYAEALDYTNKAITDGLLSPYERNVSGWLEYAGGLGGLLNDANGQIGNILSASQMRMMSQSGFEWGEYLGLNAPWELLRPPPPPR
jgi:hypothetical protein